MEILRLTRLLWTMIFLLKMDSGVVMKGGGIHGIYPSVPIMQYVGLKDRHGKEIYEGDIVNLIDAPYPMPSIVKISEKFLKMCLINIEDLKHQEWMDIEQTPSDFWLKNTLPDLEIIGNIYENPEILEKYK